MLWESAEIDLVSGLPVPFSARWPRSGSMRNGRAYVRLPSEPATDEAESSSSPTLLPTPMSRDHKGKANPPGRTRKSRPRTRGDDTLPDAVDRI
ncbi:hypothetical protein NONI108955_01105 [Nocardia ninae]|uniref:Uncharacterized protein n=1 Tax=Nocardia ninae NBRC 108245 TaxID=1210091 RepID=A0A511MBX9_9NOCA|nr:hypothetical protein NN4_26940 [Nocardia ninae NBRC 108245]